MMVRSGSKKRNSEGGQGLVEYSLLLSLVALAVVAVLVLLGPSIGNVYSASTAAFDQSPEDEEIEEELTDVVTLTVEGYNPATQVLHLHAYSDGGNDPDVTMTASPGGVMTYSNYMYPHYHIMFTLPGVCPCVVTVTSSAGGSQSVTVGH